MKLKREQNRIDVIIGGQPFTTYYFEEAVAKPYLMPLRTASGVIISRAFPVNSVSDADTKTRGFEPHQRPLYFAHGNIDALDLWGEEAFNKYYGGHELPAYGRMSLTKVNEMTEGPKVGTIRTRFNLKTPSGRVIGEETQTFRFRGEITPYRGLRVCLLCYSRPCYIRCYIR